MSRNSDGTLKHSVKPSIPRWNLKFEASLLPKCYSVIDSAWQFSLCWSKVWLWYELDNFGYPVLIWFWLQVMGQLDQKLVYWSTDNRLLQSDSCKCLLENFGTLPSELFEFHGKIALEDIHLVHIHHWMNIRQGVTMLDITWNLENNIVVAILDRTWIYCSLIWYLIDSF